MQKTIAFLLLCLLASSTGFAQQPSAALKSYQSSTNQYYWKNRKPVEGYWQQDVHYKIDAVVSDVDESVTGSEHLVYWNNSPDELTKIYFHLYQNAFTPNSYLSDMRKTDHIKSTYGLHESMGEGTVINELKVNGKVAKYTIDNTILIIELEKPVAPGSGVEFDIQFKTYWDKDDAGNIRRRMKTFRHGGVNDREFLHFDGVHWYPRISVYDHKFGWTTDQHLGKEFYGDYGVFEVSLNFPNQYVVEATGELQNFNEVYPGDLRQKLDISNYKTTRSEYTNPIVPNGTTKTWKFKAINVHDFAFTADPTYRIGEVVWKGIKCIALAQEEHAHAWQPTAQFVADVVKTYSEEIGMFGYPKMIAADARDGMEYPMLTLNGGNWPGHKYVIAHEVGHNWFFGMVGNNETYRASLDEGFTQYLTALSLKKINGITSNPNGLDDGVVYNGYMGHAMSDNTARLNIHSDHFNSAERHGGGYGQVYYRTATMLYNLQYVLGDDLFDKAIKNYFNEWKFCHPYWEDFRNSIIHFTGADLNWFFDEWIENNSTIDYKLMGIKKAGDGKYLLKIKRLGSSMPLDVRVTDKNGKVHDFYIPNTYFQKTTTATVLPTWIGWDLIKPTYEAEISIPAGIRHVEIDSSGRMADINRLNNSSSTPVEWKFNNGQYRGSSFRKYQLVYGPDLWYNNLDGIKAGIKVSGNFYQTLHKFSAAVYYNTGAPSNVNFENSTPDLLSYQIDYQTKLKGMNFLRLNSRYIDGWMYEHVGVDKQTSKGMLSLDASAFSRRNSDYLMYSLLANTTNSWESRIQLDYVQPFRKFNSSGEWRFKTFASGILSDYSYASASIEQIKHTNLKKFVLHTRIFAQYMDGASMAPESFLMMAGGNTYDQMFNKFTRSSGWFSDDALRYNRTGNHVHVGGGLNLRGYSGFAVTNNTESDTFQIFSGSRGAALNAELDFGRLFNIKARKLRRYVNLNPYIFGDAGVLGNSKDQWSGLRVDAGLGTIVALTHPKYNNVRPLNIRIDLPFFLNRIPLEQTEYVAFRYVIGVNRAF